MRNKINIESYNLGQKNITCILENGSTGDFERDIVELAQRLYFFKQPCRVKLGFTEIKTSIEAMIVPLNEKYSERRMTGTNEDYCFVGIMDFGCYSFKIFDVDKPGVISPDYLGSKLKIDKMTAVGLECFFILLNEAIRTIKEVL